MTEKEFLRGVANWDNYKPLLWMALQVTNKDILELGCGNFSTPLLQKFAHETGRVLRSYDFNEEWAGKFPGAIHVPDWTDFDFSKLISVALVDESPGEHRKISIRKLKDNCEIIVVHDSEPKGWNASDYRVRPLFGDFKYAVDIKSLDPQGAWATALSDTIDITQWIGVELGGYMIEALQVCE